MTFPHQLGHYLIERELGRGGMGVVYLARDSRLDRSVALKVLPAELQNDADRGTRFEREAKVLASLNHPCIGAIYGLEEDAGVRFLVLELVGGETLRDLLSRGALDVRHALSIAAQMADGMAAAHAQGVIHRDLKPENVKITPGRHVKILDFGLARPVALGSEQGGGAVHASTVPGTIMGTISYMSPEQARGQAVEPATDLWSFGCVLYECLTGRLAFDGISMADALAAILKHEPDWSALPPSTPPAVATMLRQLLDKDARTRFRDFQEACLLLEQAMRELDPEGSSVIHRSSGAWSLSRTSSLGEPASQQRSTMVIRALLFVDLVGSTQLVETLGDARAAAVFLRHDRVARDLLRDHGGQEIDKSDGFFIIFERPIDAVRYALAYHAALRALSLELHAPLVARAGIHLGEVILRRNSAGDIAQGARPLEVEGLSKPMAARMMSLAGGSQTLLTESAYSLSRRASVAPESASDGMRWVHHGAYVFKGVTEPIEVYEVTAAGEPQLPAPVDTEKAQRFVPRGAATPGAEPARSRLPAQLTSFVGRDRELEEVRRLLQTSRLVTLTGPGGCGKSRLALQAAGMMLGVFPDGVHYADMAPLAEPIMVAQTIFAMIEASEDGSRPLLQTIADRLGGREALLVLDNVEHVLSACASVADFLLRSCPRVRLLVTSREGLDIGGETTLLVPSLAVPAADQTGKLEALAASDAVRLFVERATAAKPSFRLTSANAGAVVEVCTRLDGIPLAIELAAARVKSMAIEAIATRLDNAFRLLTGGSRTALPRHQTLRALIDWSHDQLDDAQRTLLRRLAPFAGGWTLEAAEAVCTDDGSAESGGGGVGGMEVTMLLTQLVEKSLVSYDERGAAPRYRLLGTVRQYAASRLDEAGETEGLRQRHAHHYKELARQASVQIGGRQQVEWRGRVDSEHDNLRCALDWFAGQPRHCADEMQLVSYLAYYWQLRGFYTEGRQRMAQALEHDTTKVPTSARATVLANSGNIAAEQGDFVRARADLQECLATWRALGDIPGEAKARNNLGILEEMEGNLVAARELFEQAIELNRAAGQKRSLAGTLNNLATLLVAPGERARARAMLEEALALNRELGNRTWESANVGVLGVMAYRDGDRKRAREMTERALQLSRETGNITYEGDHLTNLAELDLEDGQLEKAKEHLEQAITLQRRTEIKAGAGRTLILLGEAHRREGDLKRAEELCAQGVEMERKHEPGLSSAAGLVVRGRIARDAGRRAAALADFLLVLEPDGVPGAAPAQVRALAALAGEALAAGKPDAAARLWATAELVQMDDERTSAALEREEVACGERVRAACGRAAINAALARMQGLTAADAVAAAAALARTL